MYKIPEGQASHMPILQLLLIYAAYITIPRTGSKKHVTLLYGLSKPGCGNHTKDTHQNQHPECRPHSNLQYNVFCCVTPYGFYICIRHPVSHYPSINISVYHSHMLHYSSSGKNNFFHCIISATT